MKPIKFGAVEISVVIVAARFQNDYVLPFRTENCGGGTTSSTRTHDAHFAREFHIAVWPHHSQHALCGWSLYAERSGIREIGPRGIACTVCAGQHHVEIANRLAQRLEGSAATPDAAVRP